VNPVEMTIEIEAVEESDDRLERGFDSAFCPDPVPDGYRWCMAYAGGSSALHAWTAAELRRTRHLPRLAAWVPTPGSDNPRQAAIGFRQWLGDHGVPPAHENGGKHVRVLWDLETGVEPDPRWVNIACGHLHSAGYFNWIYGSPGWIFGQPQRAGYLVADPDGQATLYPHTGVIGKQYKWNIRVPGGVIDEDVLLASLVPRLWQPGGRA
jgi:hypothetical protein